MSERTEAPVKRFVEEWAAAEQRGDTAFLADTLADDFVGVGPRGFLLTKGQWRQRYESRELCNESFDFGDLSVRVYGATSVVVGVQKQRSTYKGHDASGRFRGTLVLVEGDRAWRLAGIHLSPMAEE
jgi:ketosteroid isomerase-like protein